LTVALHEAVRRTFAPITLPLAIPTPRNRAYRGAQQELDRVVYGIIEKRRKDGGEADDVLAMLMAARDEETGEAMDDRQLRDEVMTMFLAGHETTANALAWTWSLLSKNPAERRKLEAEVDAVLGDRPPTFDDLASLKYTRMVVDESMRLYPPAWIVGRTAMQDDTIRGYRVPKGSFVAAATYLTHRHPGFWSNPEGFDPERFTPEASASRHRYAYIPFGAGPRICIGNAFAIMEAQLVTAMIAQRFRVDLASGAKLEPEPLITLRPRGGVPVTLRRRASTPRA
jgi:cytochrome P450